MAPRKVNWTEQALQQWNAMLCTWDLATGSRALGNRNSRMVLETIDLLVHQPFLGRPFQGNKRVVVKAGFQIFYELPEGEVRILLVWDSRRNPADLEGLIP